MGLIEAQVAGCDRGSAGDRDRTGREKVIEERKKTEKKQRNIFFKFRKGRQAAGRGGGKRRRERRERGSVCLCVCVFL